MIGMMQFAAAFVPDVYWLLAVRVVMGLFAGFTPMVMALAISLGPRERMSHAIGMVQAATFLPLAIGPNIGGLISDTFGLRTNFMLTGVILLVPAVVLHFMVKETGYDSPADKHAADEGGERPSVLGVLMLPGFVAALVILFVARFTDRTLPPYLIELDTPSGQLATITGIVVACGAVAAACSSMFYGRWAQPENTRKLLLMALAGGTIFSGLIALAANWPQVLVLRLCLGLLAGGTMSLAFTMGARLAPPSRSGVTLSMLSSCGQLGGASAPMLAGLIGQLSLRSVFLTTGAAYLVALATAALPMLGRATAHEAEPEVDAAG
jgi:MFS transporter, DHA1 family, multidrug resistance protein